MRVLSRIRKVTPLPGADIPSLPRPTVGHVLAGAQCCSRPELSDDQGKHTCADTVQPCIRVYFDGADGTGKTHMAHRVSQDYQIPMIDEGARLILSVRRVNTFDGVRADSSLSSEFQATVLQHQLNEEAKYKPPYVADRTLGNLAYARSHARNFADLWESVPASYLADLRQSVVFLVRPQRALRQAAAQDSGRALSDWDAQVRIDETVGTMFKLWRVPYVTVDMPGAAERDEFVDWCLEARGFRRVK